MVKAIKDCGVKVSLYKQTDKNAADSCFPNNWFSTHKFDSENRYDGAFFVYNMKCANRNLEIRDDIISEMGLTRYGSVHRLNSKFGPLEGTGTLVLDNKCRVVYCCISERAMPKAVDNFMERLNTITGYNYKLVSFHAKDPKGTPVYHTNVILAILEKHVVVAANWIVNNSRVLESFEASGREIIKLSSAEVGEMCGNMLQVQD